MVQTSSELSQYTDGLWVPGLDDCSQVHAQNISTSRLDLDPDILGTQCTSLVL
jgi:hypothetical protein